MSTPHALSADERAELEAQAERRQRLRALALDPDYEIPRVWRCDTCGSRNPLSATRCQVCGGMTAVDPGRGQALAEYVLIIALIAIVSIIALLFLGGTISHVLSTVGSSI